MKKPLIFLFVIFAFLQLSAKLPAKLNTKNPPARIIRTCCSFGNEVSLAFLPFIKITEVTFPNALGAHTYLGDKKERNGIIYSKKGGFIDIGHLRDIADITAYLYALILENKSKGYVNVKLGNEGGAKSLQIKIDKSLDNTDLVKIAGKVAYDLSVWHEISTWNGASYIPFVPERYSSFSVEDAFSNLLGVHLGMKAISSENNYETEMTFLIYEALKKYEAVATYEETVKAMNAVEGIWWSQKERYPSKDILILRLFDIYGCIKPMLVETNAYGSETLCVPDLNDKGKNIDDYYTLSIKTNFKIPFKEAGITPDQSKTITQRDFQNLLTYAKNQ
jgi:hypothetical protein